MPYQRIKYTKYRKNDYHTDKIGHSDGLAAKMICAYRAEFNADP